MKITRHAQNRAVKRLWDFDRKGLSVNDWLASIAGEAFENGKRRDDEENFRVCFYKRIKFVFKKYPQWDNEWELTTVMRD